MTTGPYLFSNAVADLQSDFKIERLFTVIPHAYLFANFWHISENSKDNRPENMEQLYDVVHSCSWHHGLTYQVGLGTNEKKSDYSSAV